MKFFTYAYNKPKYLIYQNTCLKKFIKEDFDFYCIDNSKENHFTKQFKEICETNSIHYVKNLKPDHSLEGTSHYAAMQWSYDTIISKTQEIVIMIDHDNFPICPISIVNILDNNHVAGFPQSRGHVEYLNPALMIFDTSIMPNKNSISFKGTMIEGQPADVGGETFFYFKNNPEVKLKKLTMGKVLSNDPLVSNLAKKYGYPHTYDIIESCFLHPRNGSNWARAPQYEIENRDRLIFELLDQKIHNT